MRAACKTHGKTDGEELVPWITKPEVCLRKWADGAIILADETRRCEHRTCAMPAHECSSPKDKKHRIYGQTTIVRRAEVLDVGKVSARSSERTTTALDSDSAPSRRHKQRQVGPTQDDRSEEATQAQRYGGPPTSG